MGEYRDLFAAAAAGDTERALARVARVDDHTRRLLLHTAIEHDRVEVVEGLATLGGFEGALAVAIEHRAVRSLRWLLATRPDDVRDPGWFPIACRRAEPALVRQLLDLGARIDDRTRGWSGLMEAARANRHDVVELLLAEEADPRGLLLAAVAGGNHALAERALALGDDVLFADADDLTALVSAVEQRAIETVRWLLERLAAATPRPAAGAKRSRARTPAVKNIDAALASAAMTGNLALVELLLEHRGRRDVAMAYIVGTDTDEATALSIAIYLLDRGAKVDAERGDKSTALVTAAAAGWNALCRFLIARGANVNHADTWNQTPLWHAASGGHLAVVHTLLEAQARLDGRNGDPQKLPIIAAVKGNHVEILVALLERGALRFQPTRPLVQTAVENRSAAVLARLLNLPFEITGEPGTAALRTAADRGDAASVQLLLDRGAVDSPEGRSAFSRACVCDHVEAAMVLASRGLGEVRGSGLVASAARRRGVEVLARVLELDPDLEARDTRGARLLHHAVYGGIDNVVFLLERGADPNARDDDGRTPYDLAVEIGRDEIAELLEQRARS